MVNHTENSWQKMSYEHTGVVLWNEFHLRDLLNIEHPFCDGTNICDMAAFSTVLGI